MRIATARRVGWARGARFAGTLSFVLVAWGCAAVTGYAPEALQRHLTGPPRSEAADAPASVPLDGVGASRETPGFATSKRVSLDGAAREARDRAHQVLEAAARLEVASGHVEEADGALLPGIDARLGGRYLDGREIGSFGEIGEDLSFGRFEPSTGIFYRVNPGAAFLRSSRFRREAEAASYDVDEARRLAMLQAGIGYLDLTLAYASHQIALGLVADAARFAEITHARARAEVGSGADVARAEAEAARARQTAARARGGWEAASIRLAVLLRWSPRELLVPDETDLQTKPIVDATAVPSLYDAADAARPDLRAAEARRQAAAEERRATWWDLLGPDVDVTFRERLTGTEVGDLDNTHLLQGFAGFAFDFGELARTRTARANARVAEVRERALRDRARGEIEAAVSGVRAAGEVIPAAQAGVDAAERSHAIQLARFEAGTGLGIEVIEAQNAQARARLDLAQAIVRYNAAQIGLAASIGSLTSGLLAAHEPPATSASGP